MVKIEVKSEDGKYLRREEVPYFFDGILSNYIKMIH
jgi:hypothetical protein